LGSAHCGQKVALRIATKGHLLEYFTDSVTI
jgi:hypothetical protein